MWSKSLKMPLNSDVCQTNFSVLIWCLFGFNEVSVTTEKTKLFTQSAKLSTFHKIHGKIGVYMYTLGLPHSFLPLWACKPMWEMQFCCCLFSSCPPTQASVHLLWYVCMSEEYNVCVYTAQPVQKLQEQTDWSSPHSGARGKPLIKQRDRNWPSWWYNLYPWNTQSAHPRAICTYTHIHTHTHPFTYSQNKMHKCRNVQTTDACTQTLVHARRRWWICLQARNN